MDSVREPKTKSNSFKSARFSSKSSSVASLLGRQRAKREAAKVKLMFAEQEAKIKQEEAMLKAKMGVLAAAVADAEYLGMKEELDLWDEDSVCDDNNNSDILTKYFSSQLLENEKNTDTQTGSVPLVLNIQHRTDNTDTQKRSAFPVFNVQQCIDTKTGATTRMCTEREDQVMPSTEPTRPPITCSLNAYAPTFQPANHSSPAQPKLSQVKSSQLVSSQPSQPIPSQPALLSECVNYMNKKDLLRWSLVTFDDRPETWKDGSHGRIALRYLPKN